MTARALRTHSKMTCDLYLHWRRAGADERASDEGENPALSVRERLFHWRALRPVRSIQSGEEHVAIWCGLLWSPVFTGTDTYPADGLSEEYSCRAACLNPGIPLVSPLRRVMRRPFG